MKEDFLRLMVLTVAITYVVALSAQQTPASAHQPDIINQHTDTLKTATKSADDKTTMLNEVVVESASRKKIPNGIAFFPSKRERNLATDATNLIEMMALTELPYDYRANAVTTANGAPIVYFIDGQEATQKDLKALNPKDVDRIEYFPMPVSGDFVGKKNVVNYVMKKYLSGGFTRIYAQQHLDGSFGDYALSSRLVYKKVTFDGYFDGSYTNTNRSGSLTTNTYKDFTYNSTFYDNLKETIDARHTRTKHNDLGAFIKTRWSHRAIDLTGTIGWNWGEAPNVMNKYATTYSPEIINSSYVESERSSLNINPYARIITKLTLPHRQTLTVNLSGRYRSDRSAYTYSPLNLSSIFNGNRGKSWSAMGILSYTKIFNSKNSIGLSAYIIRSVNDINYSGSYDGTNNFKDISSSLSASYSHSFNKGTDLSISAGFDNDIQRINGVKTTIWNPNVSVDFSHAWNNKSSFEFSSSVFESGYPASLLNDVTLRTSELLWKRGNPDLKNRIWWQSFISNTWNFSSKFSMTLNGLYTHIFNKDFNVWYTEPGREGIIQDVTDDCDVDWWRAGTKLTYKLFNKKLVLTGSFDYDFYKFSGFYHKTNAYVKGSASAVWYGNKWYVGLVCVPGSWEAYDNTNLERYNNWRYRVNLGYTYKNLNLRASIVNPFGKNLSFKQRVNTEHFSQLLKNYSYLAANSFQFTAIYTISYGKKVNKVYMEITDRLDSGALKME